MKFLLTAYKRSKGWNKNIISCCPDIFPSKYKVKFKTLRSSMKPQFWLAFDIAVMVAKRNMAPATAQTPISDRIFMTSNPSNGSFQNHCWPRTPFTCPLGICPLTKDPENGNDQVCIACLSVSSGRGNPSLPDRTSLILTLASGQLYFSVREAAIAFPDETN